MKKITFMIFAFLSTLIGFAQTETLAGWSFPIDDGTPLVIEAECGSGNLYADGTNGSSDWTGGVDFFGGHTPAEANQVCGSTANTQAYSLLNGASAVNNGKHLIFKFSTTDYEDIVLTYSTRGTANGFDTHIWAYSTDGVDFTDVSTITGTNNTSFSTKTVDFSSNTAINNQSDVYIRLTLSGAGTQTSQNNRLDNIKFVGTEVESSTPVLGCEIAVTISWEDYADVTNWRLLDANGNVAIQGGTDWDEEFWYEGGSSTKTHIVANPPYSLEITIDDWMEYCDNIIDYSVTVGGVQDISGTVSVVCDDVITQTFTIGDCPDCPAPANLSAGNLTFTSAELSWTGTSGLYDIEWGPQGFTQGNGTEVNNLTTNTYLLDGVLTAETYYNFYVRQNCGTDDVSVWAGPYTFYSGYCTVSTTDSIDYISAFSTTGGIQNLSYSATEQPAGSYANETAQIVEQAQGLSIDFSSTYEGGSWGLKIWVDVNNDFIFDDATEVVFYEANTSATKTGTVTVPANLPVGEYRVRVRGQYGSTANPPACGNVFYGSTIDFTLSVVAEAEPCTETITPVFTQVSAICVGDSLAPLPTTSTNGITGTWSPALDNTQTTTYTFTPNPDQCAEEVEMTIEVTPNVVPVFSPVNPICQGGFLLALPTTSTNGITGTWSPALNNMETTTYEFTPDPGQCAETTTMTISVNSTTIPTFSQVAPICAGDVLEPLPMVSAEGITGIWSPALNNMQTTTYTFIPTTGQCASIATMIIIVNETPDSPIAESPQTMNAGQTLAEVIVDGENLIWYSDPMMTTVVEESFEFTEGSYTFWVTQTVGDCTSAATEIQVEVTLSTNTFDNASFRTYPNPVKDFFNVSYSKEITSISVVNILGQTVIEKTVNATDTQIDMTTLPTGSYFVKVNVEGNSKMVKVIKQ